MAKRKQCGTCGDSFSAANYSRHTLLCTSRFKESELNELSMEDMPTDDAPEVDEEEVDEEEEVYLDEEEIEELLHSFQPRQTERQQSDEQSNNTSFLRLVVFWSCLFLCLWQSVFYISSSAITMLLRFIYGLLQVASKHYETLAILMPLFPTSAYLMHKLLKFDKTDFVHYVVCSSCYSIYSYTDCVVQIEGQNNSKHCNYVHQPNHPIRHHRRPCGAKLLQTVVLPSGAKRLVPYKSYYYKPLRDSIRDLTSRSGFLTKCEVWRSYSGSSDTLSDVYDGQIWKTFSEFLSSSHNYGLMLNLDWFQPFKHVKYSVGVMYMVVLNLPREERFKRENIILIGVIPHMKKEPPTNTFVQPLVDELLEAWNSGFTFQGRNFRLALMCVGCDIPACRKLCGFLGHAAIRGCSRCLKTFPGEFGKRYYSGFDRKTWKPRTHENHISNLRKITSSTTKAEREKLERLYGARYSVLSELPYFDIIRMSVIDPMHNLFMGTTKHMLQLWKDTGVLMDKDFALIQSKIDEGECPSDIGRMPRKIASGFAGFTADQFKNWTLLFSIYALKGIIPDEDLDCWRYFVLACRYICCRVITKNDIKIADALMLRFCTAFERLYGKEKVTPNMHLHGHLMECILDFGPVYSFWLFSFERCNGMMGNIPTNNKNVELQLMRRFVCHSHLLGLTLSDDFQLAETLKPVFTELVSGAKVGTLGSSSNAPTYLWRMSSRLLDSEQCWSDIKAYSYNKYKLRGVTVEENIYLSQMYTKLYNCSQIFFLPSYKELKTVHLGNTLFGSAKASTSSSNIIAYWTNADGNIDWSTSPRPGKVVRYIQHSVQVSGELRPHLLAEVRWHRELTDDVKHHCGKPVEAWHPTMFVDNGPSSFMPIQRIKSKFIKLIGKCQKKDVMFVLPRDRYIMV